MNAQIFDPADASTDIPPIAMTPAACRHVRRQLDKEGASALLLGVTESGCNGYMYELTYIDGTPRDARAFEFDDVTVFVENADWTLVGGTRIDYVTEGLNSVLKFNNPNATGECGCGESFSVGPNAEDD